MSCHKHQKAHGGKFKNDQCLTCHAEAGNRKMRTDTAAGSARETFHGESSKFPLRGGHATVQCQMCHVNDVYQNTPRECGVSCHEDSLHKGSLGQQCSRCHEPGQWPAVRFDHRTQTKWPLEGKHTQVKSVRGLPSEPALPRHADRVRRVGLPQGRRRPPGQARQPVRDLPRDRRHAEVPPQPRREVQDRRQARASGVRRVPQVGGVQAGAQRLLRLPPRAGDPQGPLRHRLRALPLDVVVRRHQARCTTSATSRCRARTTS